MICGDDVVDPGEECDPPNSEDCNNMVDDDGDGLVDCNDPDCVDPNNPSVGIDTCGEDCMIDTPCMPIFKDPATIKWGKNGKPDRLKIHGRFPQMSPIEPLSEVVGILLTNELGTIYQANLISGDMRGRVGGRRFKYKDKTAKVDGIGQRNGLYAVNVKTRVRDGITWNVFRVQAFSDLSLATVPDMTTQIVTGNDAATLTRAWTATKRGWKLIQGEF